MVKVIFAVAVDFSFVFVFTKSLATLETKKVLQKNKGKQMEGEVAAKRVREEEYEEVNQKKGLKLNST